MSAAMDRDRITRPGHQLTDTREEGEREEKGGGGGVSLEASEEGRTGAELMLRGRL